MKWTDQIKESKKFLEGAKKQLVQIIDNLPDNPRIKRLANSQNCFTINFKDLGNNWSVKHHDFKAQYRMVTEKIERSKDPRVALIEIIKNKKVVIKDGKAVGTYRMDEVVKLHDDVLKELKKLFRVVS